MRSRFKTLLGNVSPWIVIGMSLILVVVVLALAFINYNREKKYMERALSEKGGALIKSFEAGIRTGMMGMMGAGPNLQVLLQETASQPDILYIAIVDSTGRLLAHSDASRIGQELLTPQVLAMLKPSKEIQWRVITRTGKPKAFEVYKLFLPVRSSDNQNRPSSMMNNRMRQMMGGRFGNRMDNNRREWWQPGWMRGLDQNRILDPERRPVIMIGMDSTPFEEAINEDITMTATMSGILMLLGLAGVVSLFWMQSHLHSRKLLQDTQALTAEIVINIPEGIVVCGPDENITYVNSIALQMLGADSTAPAAIQGRPAPDLLPPPLWQLHDRVNKDQRVVEAELELTTGGRTKLPVAAVVTDIITEQGVTVGRLFMLRDLSQLKQLQEDIRKADRMAAIGHLAAGVAHEVRNPLSSIKGYATYFGTLFPEGSDNRKAAEVMTSEVDRLNRVISELLEMARPADIKRKETDIGTLLESSLRLVKQEAEGAGVTIVVEAVPAIGSLLVDPDRLTQALINLYVNGIQAMPNGGELTVSVRLQGKNLLLRISDTGTGLAPEGMMQIFNPYYTTKQTGTGLGLAIVQKIVEAHGGRIEVERTGSDGTTFLLAIPSVSTGEG